MAWWVYMLRCRDGSLYTGVTTDVERRFAQHRAGTGAKYTRSHPPEAVVYRETLPDKPAALRRELFPARRRIHEKTKKGVDRGRTLCYTSVLEMTSLSRYRAAGKASE